VDATAWTRVNSTIRHSCGRRSSERPCVDAPRAKMLATGQAKNTHKNTAGTSPSSQAGTGPAARVR